MAEGGLEVEIVPGSWISASSAYALNKVDHGKKIENDQDFREGRAATMRLL